MSFLKRLKIGKSLKTVGKVGKALGKTKMLKAIAKPLLRSVPVLGTAYAAYEIGSALTGGFGSKAAAPAAPSLPALPASFGGGSPSTGPGGLIPFWRGPGGKMQLPWNDPNVHASLKQFSLDDSALHTYYRAPKDYVVVRDQDGRPYPLQKWVAKKIGWWHAASKPPISAGDWSCLKRSGRVINVLKRANKTAKKVANFDPSRKVYIEKKRGK